MFKKGYPLPMEKWHKDTDKAENTCLPLCGKNVKKAVP